MNPGLRPELPVRRDPYTFQVWILEIRTPRRCDFNTADKLVNLGHMYMYICMYMYMS